MITPSSSTRNAIIGTAMGLLQTKSYNGFGFQELADKVGIRKASLYHHFKSKDMLATELIRLAREYVASALRDNEDAKGIERLHLFLSRIGRDIGVGSKICPGGALVANWGNLPLSLRRDIARLTAIYLDGLAHIIDIGRVDGSICDGQPSEAVAKWIFASFQGAIVLARATGKAADFDGVMDVVVDNLRLR